MRGKKSARRARKHTSRAIVRHESGSSMVERQPAATGGVTALVVIALILTARSARASTWHLRVWTGTLQRTAPLRLSSSRGLRLVAQQKLLQATCHISQASACRGVCRSAPRLTSFQQSRPPPPSLHPLRLHVAARKGRRGRIAAARHRLLLQADGLQGRDSDFRRRQMHVGAVR